MHGLVRLMADRTRLLLAFCIVAIGVMSPFAAKQSKHLTLGGYTVPGSQSARVDAILARNYPQLSRADLAVLLWPTHGATSGELEAAITHVERGLHGIRGITLSPNAGEQARFAAGLVGPLVIPLTVTIRENAGRNVSAQVAERLLMRTQHTHRVETHLLGESALGAAVAASSKKELATAERIGFPVLLIVLVGVFGSVAAAMLPLLLAAVALILSGAAIYFLSLATELSTFTTSTASMFSIGVAVDYSLIMLTRVRQELDAGRDMATAQTIASRTAGRAVVYSGITVILSLCAVWIVPVATLQSMAVGAMIAVGVSLVLSVTLLPALNRWLGPARLTPGSRGIGRRILVKLRARLHLPRLDWTRWTAAVTRRPLLAVVAVCALLLPLCIPAISMTTSTGALEQLRPQNPTRQGFEEAQRLRGPGALGPIFVALHSSTGGFSILHHAAVIARHATAYLASISGVGLIHLSPGGSYAVFTVTPTVDPESAAAEQLVSDIRMSLRRLFANTGIETSVGGETASQLDVVQTVAGGIWRLVAAVLLASFVLLIMLLRSLILPLKAIAVNLISIGVAYGVLVIVFQWGWLDGLLHYKAPGHIFTLVPPLILAVVFGLSMDYEIFLLARIREQWDQCGQERPAIAGGLAASAGAISSAAFVLVCVFSIFITIGNPTVKELGVGAAVAVGIDATLIRLILVPATMTLLGRWNWWWPKPLARLLPPFGHVRGGSVTSAPASAAAPEVNIATDIKHVDATS
jgi:uncharacterized membrane protein YdfJ with MMPL/SSD domain